MGLNECINTWLPQPFAKLFAFEIRVTKLSKMALFEPPDLASRVAVIPGLDHQSQLEFSSFSMALAYYHCYETLTISSGLLNESNFIHVCCFLEKNSISASPPSKQWGWFI